MNNLSEKAMELLKKHGSIEIVGSNLGWSVHVPSEKDRNYLSDFPLPTPGEAVDEALERK